LAWLSDYADPERRKVPPGRAAAVGAGSGLKESMAAQDKEEATLGAGIMSFPINLRILGEYEDVYLYKGALYMWSVDNDLQIVDWQRLIGAVSEYSDKLVLKWSFTRNDALRSWQFKEMIKDPEMLESLSRKLLRVDEDTIVLEEPDVRPFTIATISNGVGDLTDVLLYRDVLYMSTLSGVYGRRPQGHSESIYLAELDRINDLHTVSITAKYRTLTGACCEDGLFCWSSLDKDYHSPQVYHADKFTRAASWLYSDFLTLEEDSFSYHVNLRPQDLEQAKKYGLESHRQHDGDETDTSDEGSIAHYGVDVLEDRQLLRAAEERQIPRTIFTAGNSVFVCGHVNGHYHLARWTKPRKDQVFHERGLTLKASYHDIYADVFWGGAIDSSTAVLDTDRGTLIYDERGEPYVLSDDVNVGVRGFSDSKWYVNLVCSIKEDHILFSSIWPMDPRLVLGERYYDGRWDRWRPWSPEWNET
jgi:hypothetical protein